MVMEIKEQYIVDKKGNRVGILLAIEDYQRILEELETIRAFDAAKKSNDEIIPFEQAIAEIEKRF